MESSVPIHVITPAKGNVNNDLLRSIGARTGGICENATKIERIIDNITGKSPITIITQIEIEEVTQGEKNFFRLVLFLLFLLLSSSSSFLSAFFFLSSGNKEDLFFDETFQTVPDWRLTNTAWEVSDSRGAFVTGTMRSNFLKKLKIHLKRGDTTYILPLALEKDDDNDMNTSEGGSNPTKPLNVLCAGMGRLVGLIHCQQAMLEGRMLHVDPAFSSLYLLELALGYKIVSEQTSLLFLLNPQQFIDNNIDCPPNHPAYEEWKNLASKIGKVVWTLA